MRRNRALAALLWCFGACGALLGASGAAAQELPLSWDAPASCPDAASVRAALHRLLAGTSASAGVVEARARVQRASARAYRLELQLLVGAHRAQRTLIASSCQELANTAAWLIAVAVDPSIEPGAREPEGSVTAGRERSADSPSGDGSASRVSAPGEAASARERADIADEAASSAAPAVTSEPPPAPAAQPTPPAPAPDKAAAGPPRARFDQLRPLDVRAALLAGMASGASVGVQAELTASAGLAAGWLYSELSLATLLPRSEPQRAAGGSVRLWALRMGLRECALWGERLRWGPCATLDALRTAAHVQEQRELRDRALFWAAAGADLQLLWPLREQLELSGGAGANVSMSQRPRFTVDDVEVASVAPWSVHVRIGLGFVSR